MRGRGERCGRARRWVAALVAGVLAVVVVPVAGEVAVAEAVAVPEGPGLLARVVASELVLAQAAQEGDGAEAVAAEVGPEADADETGADGDEVMGAPVPPGAVPPLAAAGDVVLPVAQEEASEVGEAGARAPPVEEAAEVAPGATEVVGERTESTRVFDNGDGTFTYESHAEPIHASEGGAWVPVDPDLAVAADGSLVNGPARVDIELAPEASAEDLAVVGLSGSRSVAYGLEGAAAVEAVVDGATARYAGVLPGVDLELESTPRGLKENLVLASASAPSTFRFPLVLEGLEAELEPGTGAVLLVHPWLGTVEAVIPAGFMVDAAGTRSEAVGYELEAGGDGTTLVVTADRGWLEDPARAWPVTVDPTTVDRTSIDDTWVIQNGNADRSNDLELSVGPAFGLMAAAYVKFFLDIPANSYVTAATLNSWNSYSAGGCTAQPVGVYRVTAAWTGSTLRTWPGAAYSSTPVDTQWFAHGGGGGCPSAWGQFDVKDVVNGWLTGAYPNNGLSLRVPSQYSGTAGTYKRFGSGDTGGNGQVLRVTYTAHAAVVTPSSSWQGGVDVRANRTGLLPVGVKNLGSVTWPAGGDVRLGYKLFDPDTLAPLGNGTLRTLMPEAVSPGEVVAVVANVGALPPGRYGFVWDMLKEGAFWFASEGSATAYQEIQVVDYDPVFEGASPANGEVVHDRSPTLSIDATDPDGHPAPLQYHFRICPGPEEPPSFPGSSAGCHSSGWQSGSTWTPPDLGVWNRVYWWWGFVRNGTGTEQWNFAAPSQVVPTLEQPAAARRGPSGSTVFDGGVDLATGNFVSSTTDVSVPGGLAFERTYNSQGAGAVGSFGAGWSSLLDIGIEPEADPSVVKLTLADGRVQRWGLVTDKGKDAVDLYRGPLGTTDSLIGLKLGGWMWTTAEGVDHVFGTDGVLDEVVFRDGRRLELLRNTNGKVTTLRSTPAGPGATSRQLTLTYSAGRVATVRTDPVTVGGADRLTWTYGYTGNQLTSVCDPRPTGERGCTTFGYDPATNGLLVTADDHFGRYLTLGYETGSPKRVATRADGESHTWSYGYAANVQCAHGGAFTCSRRTVTQPHDPADQAPGTPAPLALTYHFDPAGRLTSRADEAGHVVAWEYDAAGNVFKETDENGVDTVFWHGEAGHLLALSTTRDGTPYTGSWPTTWYRYDPSLQPGDARYGLPTGIVSPRGADVHDVAHATTFGYDTEGRVTSRTSPPTAASPAGRTETIAYDPATGRVTSRTDQAGRTTTYAHDPATGDLETVTSPGGVVTEMTYDGLGRVRTVSESAPSRPTPSVTTVSYDAVGNVVRATGPAVTNVVTDVTSATLVTRTYDQARRLVAESVGVAPPSGTGGPVGARTTTWSGFDGNGRPTVRTDAAGTAVEVQSETTWTWRGAVRTVEDPGGTLYRQRYTRTGRVHQVVAEDLTGDGGTTLLSSVAYDPAGRVATAVDQAGTAVDLDYWDDGLLRARTLRDYNPDGLPGIGVDLVLDQLTYDAAGNLTERRTRDGQLVTTSTYNAADDLLTESAGGRTTTHTYRADGQRSRTSTSDGTRTEVVDLLYDTGPTRWPLGASRPTGVGGQVLQDLVERDEWGRVTAHVDPGGRRTDLDLDAVGRPVRALLPTTTIEEPGAAPTTGRPSYETGYDAFGAVSHDQGADGTVTTTTYDALGRPATTTLPAVARPDGASTVTPTVTYGHDPAARTTTVTEAPAGGTSTQLVDHLGRVEELTDAEGGVTGYAWNADGRLGAAADPGGATTLYAYDTVGNVRAEGAVERDGTTGTHWTTYFYDDELDLTSVTLPEGGALTAAHNAFGEVTSTSAPSAGGGAVTTAITRDLQGRPTAVANALGHRTETTYDLAGRATAERSYDGATLLRQITYGLNASGEVTSVTAPGPNPGDAPVTTEYGRDGHGRVTSLTQPGGITTGYGYDARGLLTRATDGNDNDTRYTHNAWGDLETVTDPATTAHPTLAERRWTHSYAAPGLLAHTAGPDGTSVTTTHDALGRLLTETGAGGDAPTDRTLTWDAAGRIDTVTSGGGTDTYNWDDRGNLLGATGASGTASFAYDGDSRMTSRTDAAGTSTFTYWPGGQLRTTDGALTGTAEHTYDGAGRLDTVSYDAGASIRDLGWDALGNPTSDVLRSGATTIASQTWAWGPDGTHLDATTVGPAPHAGAGTESYQYDAAGRLVQTVAPSGTTATGWDGAGNRTSHGGTTATYDERNRLLATTGPAGTTTSTWSAGGTLEARTPPSGPATTYAYDALDRLIGETTGSTTTSYGWDGLDRLASVDGQGSTHAGLERDPVTAAGHAFERSPGGRATAYDPPGVGPRSIRSNHRGDVTSTFTPGAGATASSRSYSPYGMPTEVGAGGPSVGFQGDWTSASGLVHMDARWYDPATGTFLTRDSWNVTGPAAASNRYSYGAADPTTHTDPTGHLGTPFEELCEELGQNCLDTSPPGSSCAVFVSAGPSRHCNPFSGHLAGGIAGGAAGGHLVSVGDGCKDCGGGGGGGGSGGVGSGGGGPSRPYYVWVRPSWDRPTPTHAPPPGHLNPPGRPGHRPAAVPAPIVVAPAAGAAPAFLPSTVDVPFATLAAASSGGVDEPYCEEESSNPFEGFVRRGACAVIGGADALPGMPGTPGEDIQQGLEEWAYGDEDEDGVCRAVGFACDLADAGRGAPGLLFRGLRDSGYALVRCQFGWVWAIADPDMDTLTGNGEACGQALVEVGAAAAGGKVPGAGSLVRRIGTRISQRLNTVVPPLRRHRLPEDLSTPRGTTFLDDASAPIGRRGSPIEIAPGTNSPAVIEGRQYTGHALDRMQGRRIMPSVVDDVVRSSMPVRGADGSIVHYSQSTNISVVLNADGSVRTVSYGQFKPR